MYTKTLQKAERVLELYREGKWISDIIEAMKPVPISKKTIKNILMSHGIDYTESRIKERKENIPKEICKLYQEGWGMTELQKKFRMTYITVRDIIDNAQIKSRTKSQNLVLSKGYPLDETVFDDLTPEAAYWVGMLHADGHISKDREYSVDLVQHKNDKDVIEKFVKFLKTDRPIAEVKDTNTLRIRFGCERIHKRLRELGFTHDKTYTGKPPEQLKDSLDFWRGVIDGDGCLWTGSRKDSIYYRRRKITLSGTEATCEGFKQFVLKNDIKSNVSVLKVPNESTWVIGYEGVIADRVATLLYKDAIVYMERKYQKYLEFIQENN